ncbi:MAG: flagellar basal-body MS-ring/collar protein FliF [Desulforegulaceae bacterium]|nr:flagellar basal-body MS-ring/collar protein FliF [Desulforegulaceae bacterium]
MNPVIEQIVNIYKNMPMPRKIIAGSVIVLVITGFAFMFYAANKTEFLPLYSGLSGEDASAVVQKLKETNVPYKLKDSGATIVVPSEKVYETRLDLAAQGLPKGGGVGFEIFDKTEFGTTEFVQQVNYKRALQGELSRTIEKFDEVEEARVMIVMPKDSVFIEDTKPASASVLLRLTKDIEESKIEAVVNLVSGAVKDLPTERITVTDTSGRILYRGKTDAEKAVEIADKRVSTQMKYKKFYEESLASRIETMLERVVGKDRAIVRVSTEMDFSKEDMSEEIYDPDELGTTHVRSRKNLAENKEELRPNDEMVSSVNPIVPPGEEGAPDNTILRGNKQEDIVNYEISKRVRNTEKPFAVLERLSVAAVIDGVYQYETDENGNSLKKYVARTDEDISRFEEVVRNAMGYNEARGDQVTVQSFQFSSIGRDDTKEIKLTTFEKLKKDYGKIAANIVLLLMFFLFVLRPVLKTVKEIKAAGEAEEEALKGGNLDITDEEDPDKAWDELPSIKKAEELAKQDMEKAANILKSWLREEK